MQRIKRQKIRNLILSHWLGIKSFKLLQDEVLKFRGVATRGRSNLIENTILTKCGNKSH